MSRTDSDSKWIRRLLHLSLISLIVATAGGLVTALYAVGMPEGSVHEPGMVTWFALVLASLATLYPAIRNLIRNEDPLEPSVIIGWLLFIYFPLPAFGIAVLGFTPTFPSFIEGADRLLPAFTTGLIIISVAATTFYAGYRISSKSREGSILPTVGRRTLLLTNVLIIWTLSVGIHLLRALEVLAVGNAFFYHLTNWHYLATLVILASFYRNTDGGAPLRLVGLILAGEVMIVTVVGFDLNLLLTLVIFGVLAYHYVGPGLTYRKLAALATTVVVLFPISEIAEDLQSGQTLQEAVSEGGLGLLWYLDAFLGRMIGTDALTMIIARTPEPVPLEWGDTLLFAIYGLVPRVIWSGKPSIIMCGYNNIYFSDRGASANTCAAMTVPGELYWNFGFIGVIAGLFVIGLLLGGLYRWFNGNGGAHNYVHLLVYALVLLQLMRFEWGVGQVVSNLVKRLGFAAIFLYFVTVPVSGSSFAFDGESIFERARVVRTARSIGNTRPIQFLVNGLSKNVVVHSRRSFPRRFNVIAKSSQLYRYAMKADRRIERFWLRLKREITDELSRLTISNSTVGQFIISVQRFYRGLRVVTGYSVTYYYAHEINQRISRFSAGVRHHFEVASSRITVKGAWVEHSKLYRLLK